MVRAPLIMYYHTSFAALQHHLTTESAFGYSLGSVDTHTHTHTHTHTLTHTHTHTQTLMCVVCLGERALSPLLTGAFAPLA